MNHRFPPQRVGRPPISVPVRHGCRLLLLGALLGSALPGLAFQAEPEADAALWTPPPAPNRPATAVQRGLAAKAGAAGVRIAWNAALGTPSFLSGADLAAPSPFSAGKGLRPTGRPDADALAVLDTLSGIMGIRDAAAEFAPQTPERDSLGCMHVRAPQVHRGLPVFGGELIVHFDAAGKAYAVNGRYVPEIAVAGTPALASEDAARLAAADLALLLGRPAAPTLAAPPALTVYAWRTAPRLAYALTLALDPAPLHAWRYWIDAETGCVLLRYNDVKSAAITGAILAGEGGQDVTIQDCEQIATYYYLWRTNYPWRISNYSTDTGYVDHAQQNPDGTVTYYVARRATATWDPEDRVEMSAGNNFNATQRYFRDVQGRRSFDAINGIATVFVHYGNQYVNAFWNGSYFVFGDGDGVTADPLTVLDVAAHEFTHGITEHTANFIYAYEPGAINESFSDIFATAIEFATQPDGRTNYPGKQPGTADWLLGEDCWLSAPALRNMREPGNAATVGTSGRQPATYKGDYWYYGVGDNGGVHINSGVQNRFFYLLAEGCTNCSDPGHREVVGIDVVNAARIAYRVLTVYGHPYCDYPEIRSAWLAAAADLDPTPTRAWVAGVSNAWAHVGVAPPAPADLGTALNAPYLVWLTGGDAGWSAQSADTQDGVLAARSGAISDGQQSWLTTTVTGPGTLTFWWKVSSEADYDFLRFFVDNQEQARISGEQSWSEQSLVLPAGPLTLAWRYTKDFSDSSGMDAGWLDLVSWAPVWTPVIPKPTASKGLYTDRVRVTWPAVSGATRYYLYRHTLNNPNLASVIMAGTSRTFDDTGAQPGTLYYYWLLAENGAARSDLSEPDTGSRKIAAPTGVQAGKGQSTRAVPLRWAAAAGATGYQVWRGLRPDPAAAAPLVETGAVAYDDASAVPGVTYYYWIASRKWQPGGIISSPLSAGVYGWRRSMAATDNAACDFDGDGRADPALYQRASGLWTVLLSASQYQSALFQLGGPGSIPVPQDFDGDGRTDIAVCEPATGIWTALLSGSGQAASTAVGGPFALPLPRDFDGDGRADPAAYQQLAGLWRVQLSGQQYATATLAYGGYYDAPCPADYDSDGRSDPAIFQVRTTVLGRLGFWQAALSAQRYAARDWNIGPAGAILGPQDFDGDRKADPAFFDPDDGTWSYWPSSVTSPLPIAYALGRAGAVPVAGDYDGDGRADPVVYEEAAGLWTAWLSGSAYGRATLAFGGPGHEPAARLR